MAEREDQRLTQDILAEAPKKGTVQRFRIVIAEGPRRGLAWQSTGDRCAVGSHPSNDLALEDPTVSRFHCEVTLDALGARVRDLGSRNGTLVDGLRVNDGYLRNGSILRIGKAALQFQLGTDTVSLPLSQRESFGSLVGRSVAMRSAFAVLEHAAASDATVLLEGETGTGKEGAAEGLHLMSARRDKPLVVIDCGAIPAALLESELFGHEKGSFTGASGARVGAFEEASGGTIFLDEIGELPLDLQPKLLRVLERKEIRRLGSNGYKGVDVRMVAATHRDLRQAVNGGTFRADLYYRLAVVRVQLPALRQRAEDVPVLVEALLGRLTAPDEAKATLRTAAFLEEVSRAAWPGNVRELRNYLERCLVFRQALPVGESSGGEQQKAVPAARGGSYGEARRQVIEEFERGFAEALMRRHQGHIVSAAEEAGMDRVSLYRLLRRHGLNQ